MDIQDRVIAILARQALVDPSAVRLDMSPEDLGLDSLGMMEAIFAIEESFDVSVPFDMAEPGASGFDTGSVAALVRAVEDLVAGARSA